MNSYWSNVSNARITRRRALAGATFATLAICASAACGGDSGDSPGESPKAGVLAKPVDTSRQAMAGGSLRSYVSADAPDFSPVLNNGLSRVVTWRCYSRLTSYPTSYLDQPYVPGEVAPDLARSWELSPDKLQVTFKLNPLAKWDSRSPTSSRPVDGEDVDFSWKQFLASNLSRANLANIHNAAAPVESIRSVDRNTVVAKLAFPAVDVFDAMALRFFVVPREAESGFDLRNTVRGSSPWVLANYEPSVGFTFAKNPNWYRTDLPYVDKVEVPIVQDYSQRLAQFRAGRIYSTDIRAEDILTTKRDINDLLLYKNDFMDNALEIRFGLAKADSPFWDVRVRRAVSMMIDRDLYGNAFASTAAYQQQGIEVPIRWATICGFNQGIRPQSKEFGPASAYYRHDLPEAKKLLTAAGFGSGLTTDAIYRTQSQGDFNNYDAILGMLRAGGINTSVKTYDTTLEFTPKVIASHGDFDGIAFLSATAWPLVDSLVRRYTTDGAQFPGFDGTGGRARLKGDQKIDDLATKIRMETDIKRRGALIDDVNRYLGDSQYVVTPEASGPPFSLAWPRVKNALVFRAQQVDFIPAESDIHLWIDSALPPIS